MKTFFLAYLLFGAVSNCWALGLNETSVCRSGHQQQICDQVSEIIDLKDYNSTTIEVDGTRFYLFLRKRPELKNVDWVQPIRSFWPILHGRIGLPVKEAAIVDFEAPFTGGSLGPHILGIFSSSSIEPDFQEVLGNSTGWAPENSTIGYIHTHYGIFQNPQQAYLEDMIVHELAHLYFGFGETKVGKDRNDWWFALGLGLLYDRMIWSGKYKEASPLFRDTAGRLKYYQGLPVDQRLVNPDVSLDEKYHLPRLQVYGHAKALEYLTALRTFIGGHRFDSLLRSYLKRSVGKELAYDDFIVMLSPNEQSSVRQLEIKFSIR